MAEQESRKTEYREARSAFDRLHVEDRAVFLVEATLSTVARGIEQVGQVLADELDTLFHERPWEKEEPSTASEQDASEAAPTSEEATSSSERASGPASSASKAPGVPPSEPGDADADDDSPPTSG